LVLGADLGTRDSLVHGRRATDKELDVFLLRLGEDSLQESLVDEARATLPVLRGLVEDVEGTEALGVGVLEILQLLLQENILLGDVTEDQSDLSLVLGVLEDLTGELVHGGDTGATGDQGDVVMLVGFPGVLDKRTLEGKALVDVHGVQVLRHGTVGIGLDDKLKVTGDVWNLLAKKLYIGINACLTLITGGSVGTEDVLLSTLGLEAGQQSSFILR
jgi:hypothetical protein